MTELEQYISSSFDVTKEDSAKIASLFEPEVLKKGEYFVKAGDICDKLSFVQSGFLRVHAFNDAKEVTQWIGTKGFFVSDLAGLIFNNPSRFNFQALTDITLYTIQKKDYCNIALSIAQWPEIEKRFIAKCFIIMENRIFAHLSMSAEERYSLFFNQNKELFNQVPLQYIASMLGMTPETFSRIRKKQLSPTP